MLKMSKKNNTTTIADLWKINKVLKKVTSKESKMLYGRIGKKEELQIALLMMLPSRLMRRLLEEKYYC